MAKAAFRVEDGIIPGHTDADLGHTAFKFRDVHMSRNTHIDGNADIGGNLDVSGSTNLENLSATGNTINLPNFSGGGGGGGGGVSQADAIAFAIALG